MTHEDIAARLASPRGPVERVARRWWAASERFLADVRRVWRVLFAPRKSVIGYTRSHPIYTVLFEENPPRGFVFFRPSGRRVLAPLERLAWRRASLVHLDASTRAKVGEHTPIVVSCEGRPAEEFLRDRRVKQIYVHSRWAGGDMVDRREAKLLRLTVPEAPHPVAGGSPNRPLVIATVGYGMVKGHDVAFRVFDTLRNEFPLHLVIAGAFGHNWQWYPEISREAYERIDFPSLERRIRSDPHVTMRTFSRPEVLRKVFPLADVYLHLARMDTYPLSVLEAMSFGLPIVATRLNAIAEMVKHGEGGFLVEHGGLDEIGSPEWAERVHREATVATRLLLADAALRSRMGEGNRARLRHAFSMDFVRSELEHTYSTVIRRS